MAKSSADDQELRRACEAAIEGTKQSVVMSIRVAKSRGIWGKTHKLGRDMAKPRVLALSGTPSFRYFSLILEMNDFPLRYAPFRISFISTLETNVATTRFLSIVDTTY